MVQDAQSLPAVFHALLHTRNRAADFALAAALPQMTSAEQALALDVLLERDHEPALAQVVAGFDGFEQGLRFLLAREADRLGGGVRICMAHEAFEVRRAGISLIQESGSCRLAYLLGEALAQPCRKTAQLAAQTLLMLTERVATVGQRPARTTGRRTTIPIEGLLGALRQALLSWPLHYRSEIVEAAALLSDCLEETIVSAVADSRRKIAHAFNGVLSKARDPRLAGFVLRALRAPELRETAARLIARVEDDAFSEALLAESWLLADPEIRKGCARIRGLPFLESDVAFDETNNQRARRLVRLLSASGLGHSRKAALLEQRVRAGGPVIARFAGWAIIDCRLSEAGQTLEAAAARYEGPLSRIAGLEMRRRAEQPYSGAAAPGTAEAGAVRTHGPAAASRKTFDAYWSEFDGLEAGDRVEIGRSVKASTPAFDKLLAERLDTSQSADRIRALRMVGELELHETFEKELYHAARDADVVARSMAVAMLAHVDTATSRRILREALGDRDMRVQANAVESLDSLGVDEGGQDLLSKLESPNNRVRANAVRALLRLRIPDAAAQLIEMLTSDSQSNRISALWVVERLGLVAVMERLVSIAADDPDPRVRRRAQRVSKSLAGRASSEQPRRTMR